VATLSSWSGLLGTWLLVPVVVSPLHRLWSWTFGHVPADPTRPQAFKSPRIASVGRERRTPLATQGSDPLAGENR
jgi:hypothetical protein